MAKWLRDVSVISQSFVSFPFFILGNYVWKTTQMLNEQHKKKLLLGVKVLLNEL